MNLSEAAPFQGVLDAIADGTATPEEFRAAREALLQVRAYVSEMLGKADAYRVAQDALVSAGLAHRLDDIRDVLAHAKARPVVAEEPGEALGIGT